MRRSLCVVLFLLLCSSALFACGGGQATAPTPTATSKPESVRGTPSTSFQLTGLISHPGTFALSDLQAMPKVTVMINAKPVGAHSFGGVLLYTFLQQAGIITDSVRKNDILRKAVLVTGTDGYAVAVALGEIIPKFANKQVLLAYEEDSKPLPQADGFARLIVPGDVFAGRYVSNVAQVAVVSPGPVPTLQTGAPSTSLILDGKVTHPAIYDLAALKALTATQVSIPGGGTPTNYSGVLLNTLLTQAGSMPDKKKNGILRLGVVAVGSDGYSVLVVGGEFTAKFGNLQILVASSADGQPLGADGFARLIVPGDQAMGRFVSNLVELQIVALAAS